MPLLCDLCKSDGHPVDSELSEFTEESSEKAQDEQEKSNGKKEADGPNVPFIVNNCD